MTLHEIGPYTASEYELLFTSDGITKPIDEPSILLDKATLTIHKMGSKEIVEKKFNKMATRISAAGKIGEELLRDLMTLTFDDATFSPDDLATIFNAAYHCTSSNIIKYIVTSDATLIRNEIDKLQKCGY